MYERCLRDEDGNSELTRSVILFEIRHQVLGVVGGWVVRCVRREKVIK